ncbi:MAG: hypothetical protein HYX69_21295 [Planctomycetia bacterium]|nr:hypothetical protein [Planctomycetia bacterium]
MKTLLLSLAIMAALWVVGGAAEAAQPARTVARKAAAAPQIYTCPMHPQIRWSRPDACPVCGMKMTAVKAAQPTTNGQVAPRERMDVNRDSTGGDAEMNMNHGGMGGMSGGMGGMSGGMGMGCGCMEMGGMGGGNGGAAAPASRKAVGSGAYGRGGGRSCGC